MFLGITKKTIKNLEFGVEEIILFLIIILNIFDGFEWINSEWDFIKKIISWSALGFLIYRTNLSKIFTGTESRRLNILLITAYFLFILKNLNVYSFISLETASSFMLPLFVFLTDNSGFIELFGLGSGMVILIYCAVYFALKIRIKNKSILYLFIEKSRLQINFKTFSIRFLAFFSLSILFFIGFFNLFMEWLAIAIDAPLVIVGLAIYLFFIIKNKKHFQKDSFLSNFGGFGSNIYKNFISHLRYKHTLFLACGAILALHMVTDAFSFMWPYITGKIDPLYFSFLGENHTPLIPLFFQNISGASLYESVLVLASYVFNLVGLSFLLIFPLWLWIKIYRNEELALGAYEKGFIFFCISVLAFVPLFNISGIKNSLIAGVDIQTKLIGLGNLNILIGISLCIGILIYLMSKLRDRLTTKILILCSMLFFITYIYLYFISILKSYLFLGENIFVIGFGFPEIIFLLFLLATGIFYILGISGFSYNIWKFLKKRSKLY